MNPHDSHEHAWHLQFMKNLEINDLSSLYFPMRYELYRTGDIKYAAGEGTARQRRPTVCYVVKTRQGSTTEPIFSVLRDIRTGVCYVINAQENARRTEQVLNIIYG